ncbi:OLC1v1020415C1 [Oldenlandia corymbosa var. corymbosa]|uniref:OLC1v1020415C1 n=1 Tax=Oldenlandia corymbosa var. corymbosa TaxID=529605 RepID=A0AAV1EGV9_OLDCO|nr:OLC1v1020415C1 [Oldenlandia corymbosa var. corymbosa]
MESSCHGLVLLISQHCTFLMNPLTSELVKIPSFASSSAPDHVPRDMEHVLGYDGTNDDYKIVLISYPRDGFSIDDPVTNVDIYSTISRTWKHLGNSTYHHCSSYAKNGVFLNGYAHFLAPDHSTSSSTSVIAVFDLTHEKFDNVLPPPPNFESDLIEGRLMTTSEGCLALILKSNYDFDIWETGYAYSVKSSGAWRDMEVVGFSEGLDGALRYIECADFADDLDDDEEAWRDMEAAWKDLIVEFPNCFGTATLTFKESLLPPNYISGRKKRAD